MTKYKFKGERARGIVNKNVDSRRAVGSGGSVVSSLHRCNMDKKDRESKL